MSWPLRMLACWTHLRWLARTVRFRCEKLIGIEKLEFEFQWPVFACLLHDLPTLPLDLSDESLKNNKQILETLNTYQSDVLVKIC